jgi:hypothetical protein
MRSLVLPAVLVGMMGVASCSGPTHGVAVTNQTDRIVKAELLQLRKDGEMTVYSTQTIGLGGEFRNMVAADDYRRGMRVRFRLADQGLEEQNWVMLNLPDNRDRVYDLVLIGPRLSAREMVKGLKPKVAQ